MITTWFYGVGVPCPPHDFHMISYPGAWPACGWPNYHMISTWCHTRERVQHVDDQSTTWLPHNVMPGVWASMWITNLPHGVTWVHGNFMWIYQSTTRNLHVANWLFTWCVWSGKLVRERVHLVYPLFGILFCFPLKGITYFRVSFSCPFDMIGTKW